VTNYSVTTTTTTKPYVPSIWGRLHEPKENYARSGTWISFLHSFLSSNMPSLRPLASISCRITSIHVFFGLPGALLTTKPYDKLFSIYKNDVGKEPRQHVNFEPQLSTAQFCCWQTAFNKDFPRVESLQSCRQAYSAVERSVAWQGFRLCLGFCFESKTYSNWISLSLF